MFLPKLKSSEEMKPVSKRSNPLKSAVTSALHSLAARPRFEAVAQMSFLRCLIANAALSPEVSVSHVGSVSVNGRVYC